MAVVIGRKQVGVERTTVRVTVPNNPTARLMYYLECVCHVISCGQDEDIRRFSDYANWERLSDKEKKFLLMIFYIFSPDVFFHNEELCVEFSNEFYMINQIHHRFLAAKSIIIGGRTHQVNKIMAYQMSWMRKNCLEPMQQLTAPSQRQPQPRRQITAPHRSHPVTNSDCCCIIQ
ncbi:unnamed protein product [Rotaria socialis]|uniref:Uncharacterized protein n=1 Tax=Rotaria socialis TaxID=392032 RepID=A0A818R651_9BILA|nr:unnamed protein product [Rotaria socialis]CAF4273158.1 unnamed protein product [Rotaria socialis]